MPRTSEPGRSVSSRLLEILFAFRAEQSDLSLTEPCTGPGSRLPPCVGWSWNSWVRVRSSAGATGGSP
jgi:hypothetical protein